MLTRTLEPEIMDSHEEAREYDAMDHQMVNEAFAAEFLAVGNFGVDCLDLGTGTALIPIEICLRDPDVRIMALDASQPMLELARYRLELASLTHRIQLCYGNANALPFEANLFDAVFSNTILHHLPEPKNMLVEAWRVLRPNGLLFVRDLVRPSTSDEIEALVEAYTHDETDLSKQLFRQSFHAALTLEEVADLLGSIGIPPQSLQMSSNRHWTLIARKEIGD